MPGAGAGAGAVSWLCTGWRQAGAGAGAVRWAPVLVLCVLAFATVVNRPQPSASTTVRDRPQEDAIRPLPSGEGFEEGLAWKRDVSDSCEISRKRVET